MPTLTLTLASILPPILLAILTQVLDFLEARKQVSRQILMVPHDAPLAVVDQLFEELQPSHIYVCQRGQLLGHITRRQLVKIGWRIPGSPEGAAETAPEGSCWS